MHRFSDVLEAALSSLPVGLQCSKAAFTRTSLVNPVGEGVRNGMSLVVKICCIKKNTPEVLYAVVSFEDFFFLA